MVEPRRSVAVEAWSTYQWSLYSNSAQGFKLLCKTEGIIPALEPSHAIYQSVEIAKKLPKDKIVLCCLSGRGDKDMITVAKALGVHLTM